jgi:O-antigen ligase
MWIPVVWMFIMGSRLPSQWLGGQVGQAADALEDGNPLDRTIFLVLILLAIGVLIFRSLPWAELFARNLALMGFLAFALISVAWSDYPFVAFKRWFRDLGNYLMILVVLSDPLPMQAIRTLLRRLGYLLIPLSIVLIKYYPEIGKAYSEWTGKAYYSGVATDKNMLGVLCLLTGVFFFWEMLTQWTDQRQQRKRWTIFVSIVFIYMTLWILNLADSATSGVCLAVGCLVIAAAHIKWVKRHPNFLRVIIPMGFCAYLVLAFGLDMMGDMAESVGRDPTLTDRTLIWQTVLNLHTNALVGTGYESFWLGPRLLKVWQAAGHINEAHDGYLEVYLNLGLIGLSLMAAFLISSYLTIGRRLKQSSPLASYSLAMWTVLLFYNVTEAALKSHLMWVVFLLGAIVLRERAEEQPHMITDSENEPVATEVPDFSWTTQ